MHSSFEMLPIAKQTVTSIWLRENLIFFPSALIITNKHISHGNWNKNELKVTWHTYVLRPSTLSMIYLEFKSNL